MKTNTPVALLSLTLCCASIARAEEVEWIRQFGTSLSDISYGVSADGLGSVYISGKAEGCLKGAVGCAGGDDAFISKYNASGTLEWTRQLGTSEGDKSYGVSADGLGNVYIAGKTYGCLAETCPGNIDAFLSKYDASGTLEWTQQLGTIRFDYSRGVSADGLGNVYISGDTNGNLAGPSAGDYDAFISKYDASGAHQWTRQLGTSSYDVGRGGVSADGLGNVYISGSTSGSLGALNEGRRDAFVAKIMDPLLGDVNFDGNVNGLDVDPFVEVLLHGDKPAWGTPLRTIGAVFAVRGRSLRERAHFRGAKSHVLANRSVVRRGDIGTGTKRGGSQYCPAQQLLCLRANSKDPEVQGFQGVCSVRLSLENT